MGGRVRQTDGPVVVLRKDFARHIHQHGPDRHLVFRGPFFGLGERNLHAADVCLIHGHNVMWNPELNQSRASIHRSVFALRASPDKFTQIAQIEVQTASQHTLLHLDSRPIPAAVAPGPPTYTIGRAKRLLNFGPACHRPKPMMHLAGVPAGDSPLPGEQSQGIGGQVTLGTLVHFSSLRACSCSQLPIDFTPALAYKMTQIRSTNVRP